MIFKFVEIKYKCLNNQEEKFKKIKETWKKLFLTKSIWNLKYHIHLWKYSIVLI